MTAETMAPQATPTTAGADTTAPQATPTTGADSSTAAAPRNGGLWRGRVILILGIVLMGITLRHAVTGLSPLLPVVREQLGIGVSGASLLGMLPTLSFGVAGFLAPVMIRRRGPELTGAAAMLLAAGGTFGRSLTAASRCSSCSAWWPCSAWASATSSGRRWSRSTFRTGRPPC